MTPEGLLMQHLSRRWRRPLTHQGQAEQCASASEPASENTQTKIVYEIENLSKNFGGNNFKDYNFSYNVTPCLEKDSFATKQQQCSLVRSQFLKTQRKHKIEKQIFGVRESY